MKPYPWRTAVFLALELAPVLYPVALHVSPTSTIELVNFTFRLEGFECV